MTLIAGLIAVGVRAPDKWLPAIYATVVPFGGVISSFRKRWASREFWAIIAGALLVQLVLAWFIFAVVLRSLNDVGLLVCVPVMFLEAAVLYYAVRFLQKNQENSDA